MNGNYALTAILAAFIVGAVASGLVVRSCSAPTVYTDTIAVHGDTVTIYEPVAQYITRTKVQTRTITEADSQQIVYYREAWWDALSRLSTYETVIATCDTALTRTAVICIDGKEFASTFTDTFSLEHQLLPNEFRLSFADAKIPVRLITSEPVTAPWWSRFGWGPYIGIGTQLLDGQSARIGINVGVGLHYNFGF